MKDFFKSVMDSMSKSRYKDLDSLRYQVLRYVFTCIIVIVGFSVVYYYFTLGEDLYKSLYIGLPIAAVSVLGLYMLPRIALDSTIAITFTLMYIGVYTAGLFNILGVGFVILVLNMILILTLFFIKSRSLVIVACLTGVIANIFIIQSTSIFLHEYLIGSVAFLSFFYAFSTLIFKYQETLIIENKNIESKNQKIQLLLKEIHHRVKNNLQTISSILYLQSVKMTDTEAKEAIIKGQHRIESMALIHKNLYQRNNLAGIEMKEYITSLSDNLENAHGEDKDIKVIIAMVSTEVNIDIAIPLGLILNEILTNAFEYAFIHRDYGKIMISMNQNLSRQYVIEILDNGIGNNSTKNMFGNKLIRLLTKQINATFEEGNQDGYWCRITLE